MYNLVGNHPVWGNNIQMSPKQMKLVEETNDKISLRGYGTDATGASFADYGITLHKNKHGIEKITLHMFDRSIEIVYSEGNPTNMDNQSDKSQEINIVSENRGVGPGRAIDELWESWKSLNNGLFKEDNEKFELTNKIGEIFTAFFLSRVSPHSMKQSRTRRRY